MQKAKILLVDDEPNLTSALVRSLDRTQFEIFTADSAQQGLMILAGHDIDVVVSDERMPGMSGVELAAELSRRHPQVRAILLTGYEGVDVDRALDARARNVLTKPVSIVDLQRVLDEVA